MTSVAHIMPLILILGFTVSFSLLFRLNAGDRVPKALRIAFHAFNISGSFLCCACILTEWPDCLWLRKLVSAYVFFWLYILCNGMLVLVFSEIIRAGFRAFGKRYSRSVNVAAAALYVFAAVVIGYCNYRHIRVVEIGFAYDGDGYRVDSGSIGSTGDGNPFRVVFASDVHLGVGIGAVRLGQFLDRIRSLDPDMVIFGGDLLDHGADIPFEEGCAELLGNLDVPYGVYAVYGNHEYYANDMGSVDEFYRKAGITVLRDSSMAIGDWIFISGNDDAAGHSADQDFPGWEHLPSDRSVFRLGISHRPDRLADYGYSGYDLALCGHTHNGQFFPGNLILKLERKHSGNGCYSYGMYSLPGGSHGFVSCGLGLWGPHFRTFSQSEILLVKISR